MSALVPLLRRELSLAWAGGAGPLVALGFYAALVTLLPLALGADAARLEPVATGVAWIALALASLLSLETLFAGDLESGALDLLLLGPAPMEAVAAIKCLALWLATGLPLALVAPVATLALGGRPDHALLIAAVAALGGLAFSFVGGAGAALALASRRGGVLIALVVLPLIAPPVIFGGGALAAAAGGGDWRPGLALLAAYALAAVGLAPLAMAAGCRNAVS